MTIGAKYSCTPDAEFLKGPAFFLVGNNRRCAVTVQNTLTKILQINYVLEVIAE